MVYSVIERTPEKLLREVILVDDFSDMEHTKKPLEEYMGQFPKVKTHDMIKCFIFIPYKLIIMLEIFIDFLNSG